MVRKSAFTLISITFFQSLKFVSEMRLQAGTIPAFAHRTSICGCSFAISSNTCETALSSVKSQSKCWTVPISNSDFFKSIEITREPLITNLLTIADPMPDEPPVTTAILLAIFVATLLCVIRTPNSFYLN